MAASQPVIIGSKGFTESHVLAEIAKRVLEKAGFQAEHPQEGIGGTIILWQALTHGAITTYPEYTGTITEEILKTGPMSVEEMRKALARQGIGMTGELGFNNTYALVMRRVRAQQLGITKISDLRSHPELAVGVSHEFLERRDGWKPLAERYGLQMQNVRGIDHMLGYVAVANGSLDIMDAYSTDAKIAENNLVTLKDDLNFFPQYRAVFLYRLDADPRVPAALRTMEGTLSDARMTQLNAIAEQSKDYSMAAAMYFKTGTPGKDAQPTAATDVGRVPPPGVPPLASDLARWTARHLLLVGVSLFFSTLIGIPLGIWASRPGWASHLILGTTGLMQTIPALALLALLVSIPFLGISPVTAIIALVLYGLLPIVRNTATGLQDIPVPLRESAAALGLEPRAQLFRIFIPMASRSILAGIKTSAVISVGTATLAALIGAGGLGEPILSGLNLNDHATILEGAIPAALLALLVQTAFDFLDRLLIPKGLRLGNRR